jgi:hypothetical protein
MLCAHCRKAAQAEGARPLTLSHGVFAAVPLRKSRAEAFALGFRT